MKDNRLFFLGAQEDTFRVLLLLVDWMDFPLITPFVVLFSPVRPVFSIIRYILSLERIIKQMNK